MKVGQVSLESGGVGATGVAKMVHSGPGCIAAFHFWCLDYADLIIIVALEVEYKVRKLLDQIGE